MSKINRFYVFLSSFCLSLIFILPFFYVKVDSVSADSNVNYYKFEGSNLDAPSSYYKYEYDTTPGEVFYDYIDVTYSHSDPVDFYDKFLANTLTRDDLVNFNYLVIVDSNVQVFVNAGYKNDANWAETYGSDSSYLSSIVPHWFTFYDYYLDGSIIQPDDDPQRSCSVSYDSNFKILTGYRSDYWQNSSTLSMNELVSVGNSDLIFSRFGSSTFDFSLSNYNTFYYSAYDLLDEDWKGYPELAKLTKFRYDRVVYRTTTDKRLNLFSSMVSFGSSDTVTGFSHSWPSSFSSELISSSPSLSRSLWDYNYFLSCRVLDPTRDSFYKNSGPLMAYLKGYTEDLKIDIYTYSNGFRTFTCPYSDGSWSGSISTLNVSVVPTFEYFNVVPDPVVFNPDDYFTLIYSQPGTLSNGIGFITIQAKINGVYTTIFRWDTEASITLNQIKKDSFGSFTTDLSTSYIPGSGRAFVVNMSYLDIPSNSLFSYQNFSTDFTITSEPGRLSPIFTNYDLTSSSGDFLPLCISIDGFTSDNISGSSSYVVSSVLIGSSLVADSVFDSYIISRLDSAFVFFDSNFNFYSYVFSNGVRVTFFIPYSSDLHLLDFREYFLDPDLSSSESYLTGYSNGYSDGKSDGITIGYSNGYKSGYDSGYFNGHVDGVAESSDYSFNSLIGSVVDVPVKTFSSLFDVELFGFNLKNLFISLFTACVFLVVIKLILRSR